MYTMQFMHEMARLNGASFVSVKPYRGFPAFTYSIGFHRSYNWPELMVVGPRFPMGAEWLRRASDHLDRGRVEHGTLVQLDERTTGCLIKVRLTDLKERLRWAVTFYGHLEFPAMQLVLPDADGRFPWEAGYFGDWSYLAGPAPVLPVRSAA
jgi:hypothetical protein